MIVLRETLCMSSDFKKPYTKHNNQENEVSVDGVLAPCVKPEQKNIR